MGILGSVKLVKRTRDVTIGVSTKGEEIKVKVSAPSLTLASELRKRIAPPEAPKLVNSAGKVRFKTNPRTGEPIKENGQLVPMLNYADPAFVIEAGAVERARTIAMIFECTEFPGNSTVEKNGHTPVGYELARWKELEKAGLTVGEYNDLGDACNELSQPMTKSEIEDARREFGADQETQDAVKEVLEKKGKKAPAGK